MGYGGPSMLGTNDHALLWTGSASSVVDLNPAGFSTTTASGTNGIQQVGSGQGTATNSTASALLWSGSASSVVNLQRVLPVQFTSSHALTISGKIVYGTATDASGNTHAIEWQLVSSLPAIAVVPGQIYQFGFNAGSGVSARLAGSP